MRRPTMALVLVATVLASVVVTGATPASAAPTATATPSTDLRPGDTVTASGSGFSPDDVVTIAQCSVGGCALPDGGQPGPLPNVAVATISSDGTLTGRITVTASVDGDPCRPDRCWVSIGGVVGGQDGVEVARVPLAFVTPRPTVRLEVTGPVLDRHPVVVRADGLDAGAVYRFAQCWGTTGATCLTAADDPTPPDRLPRSVAESTANQYTVATGTVLVRRTFPGGGATRDCASTTCRLGVLDRSGRLLVSTPIPMAVTGSYAWPAATLTATGTTGLLDRSSVVVRVEGLDPWMRDRRPAFGDEADLETCPVDPAYGGRCSTAPSIVYLDTQGRASGAVQVDRTIRLDVTREVVDCAVVGCQIRVSQLGNPRSGPVELAFAPEWTPWPDVDRFLTEGVEAVRGAPLPAADRARLRADLVSRAVRGDDALVAVTGATPSDATVGEVSRLYRAFFGRAVETGGLAYWVGRLRSGATVATIGRSFGGTPEFRAQYDGRTNAQVVEAAYRNTLGRAPDAAGTAYWVGRLDTGMARSTLIVHFARSPELRAREDVATRRTQLTFGLLGRAPRDLEVFRTPLQLAGELLRSGDLPHS